MLDGGQWIYGEATGSARVQWGEEEADGSRIDDGLWICCEASASARVQWSEEEAGGDRLDGGRWIDGEASGSTRGKRPSDLGLWGFFPFGRASGWIMEEDAREIFPS
jgi:hypothetical protein